MLDFLKDKYQDHTSNVQNKEINLKSDGEE
jgi:hypothetical protein